jgi:signal transduction histidine kinase
MSKNTAILLMCFAFSTMFAQNNLDTLKVNGANTILLGNYYHSFEDASNAMTPDQVVKKLIHNEFKPVHKDSRIFNGGFTKSTFWLALKVTNTALTNQSYAWNFYNDGISFDFFEIKNKNPQFIENISAHKPLEERKFKVLFPCLKIDFEPAETKLLLVKIKPTIKNNIYTTSDFTTVEDYFLFNQFEGLFFGLFLGFLALALLTNIFLFILLRNKIYVYLVFYLTFLLFFFIREHLYDAVLLPKTILKYEVLIYKNFFSSMALFFFIKVFLLFTNYKIKYPKIYPFINYINLAMLAMSIVLLISSLIFASQNELLRQIRTCSYNLFYMSLTVYLLALIYALVKKNKTAYAFLVSNLFMFLSVVFLILHKFGIATFGEIRHLNGIKISFLIEITLLTAFFVYGHKKERDNFIALQLEGIKINADLTSKILKVQEDERESIARDLHDEVGSGLTVVRLMIENYFNRSQNNDDKEAKQKIISSLKNIYEEVRDISQLMMPECFDYSDLKEIVEEKIQIYQSSYPNILFSFNHTGDFKTLEKSKQTHLYRIIIEIIHNAIKHAIATKTDIQIYIENNEIEIIIEDNGIGFKKDKINNGIGLSNVQTRIKYLKGTYSCDTNTDGTIFIIQIPL